MRVCALVTSTHVVPGRTIAPSGCKGPEASLKRTVTASTVGPGLKTSSAEEPPESSWAWGIIQWAWARGTPGRTDSPPGEPARTRTSDATTRPVRAWTTVETVEVSCTSLATFSTCRLPGGNTIPW